MRKPVHFRNYIWRA